MTGEVGDFLDRVAESARAADVFGRVERADELLKCEALNAAEDAWFCVGRDPDHWFVALVTHDRWLNESIEADLLHRGEPIEELLGEELDEIGFTGDQPPVKHYRSDEMLYTYRSPLPLPADLASRASVDRAVQFLLAYQAVFRELGEMTSTEDRDRDEDDD